MKTIIAPTDFSPASLNAVNYAAMLACTLQCDLLLLHIYPLPVMVGEVPVPIYTSDNSEAYNSEKLDTVKKQLLAKTKQRINISTIVAAGDVLQKIEECCIMINPYAVVTGPETSGLLGELAGAAITEQLMQTFKWPVIIVPENAHFASIRKIGMACDFKKVVNTLPVPEIKKIITAFSAELHILHVHDDPSIAYDENTIEESGWLQEMLYDIQPHYHLINNTKIEEGIEQFVQNNKLDMLIVIPRKHSVLHNIFIKSHSKELTLHTQIPILSVHEQSSSI